MQDIEQRVRRWMEDDPDPESRAELASLLDALGEDPGGTTVLALAERFSGPLRFGTAGLRAPVGAGESWMNRATVIRATAGLAEHLLEVVPDVRERGVVVGRDARRGSERFQVDVAAVLAARDIPVLWLPGVVPTPVVAFGVRRLGAAAGVMITASHNPPADNGYKVYWGHGAQILAPTDADIAAAIDRQPGARFVPRRPAGEGIVERGDLVDAYLDAVARVRFVPEAPVADLRIAYTPLHGVGKKLFVEALVRRGVGFIEVVPEQAEPDPSFPTVAFPNPEEPGALDLLLALAERTNADLALAHDPDADRLAAAVRCPQRGFVVLSGDELGVLLARHLIDHDQPEDKSRLVVSTVVSSRLLGRMASDLGVRHAETLTGFKHIAARMRQLEADEALRALFGYEEALGYAVSREVHDKDGITAGLALAEMAAVARADGRSLLDVLEAIHRAHGLFLGRSRSLRWSGPGGQRRIAAAMQRLRQVEVESLGAGLDAIWDLANGTVRGKRSAQGGVADMTPSRLASDAVVLQGPRARAAFRPSGTEPKLKLYLEVEATWPIGQSYADARSEGQIELDRLESAVRGLLGLDPEG